MVNRHPLLPGAIGNAALFLLLYPFALAAESLKRLADWSPVPFMPWGGP